MVKDGKRRFWKGVTHTGWKTRTAKAWIAPSEPVDNIQQGKVKAEAYAKEYLKNSVNLELPSLEWKSSRSI